MPSGLRALRQVSTIAVVGAVFAGALTTGTAYADSCLTVDDTGACFGTGSTIPSQTVGGPTTISGVSTPSESVPAPTTVCVLVTCINKGDTLVSVPSITVPTVTVPLPQETTPAVTVPLGSPTLHDHLVQCAPSGTFAGVAAVEDFEQGDLRNMGEQLGSVESGNPFGVVGIVIDAAEIVAFAPLAFAFEFADVCLQ